MPVDTRLPLKSYSPIGAKTRPASSTSSLTPSTTTSRLGWAQATVYASAARHRLLVAGRRFGKSHLSISEVKRTALDINARPEWVRKTPQFSPINIKYLYPTLKQARSFIWEPLKAQTEPWHDGKPNNSDNIIHLKSRHGVKSTVTLGGADVDPDSHRGGGLDLVIYDEAAFMKDLQAIRTVIKPSLSERVGRELLITSPNSYNAVFDMYNAIGDKPADWAEWARFQYTTADGGRVPESEMLKDKRNMDPRKYRQEYYATFESMNEGSVYYAFDDDNVLKAPVPFNPHCPIILCIDLNVSPLCACICQKWDPSGFGRFSLDPSEISYASRIYVLDEIFIEKGATTHQLMEAFAHKTRPYVRQLRSKLQVWLYGDASMHSDHTSSRHSDYEIIMKWFQGQEKYEVIDCVPSSNPEIRTRVEAVNSFLLNAEEVRRLYLNPQCEKLKNDFRRVVWEDGTGLREDQKTDKMLTHMSSALGYYLHPISEYAAQTEVF